MGRVFRKVRLSIMLDVILVAAQVVIAVITVADFVFTVSLHKKSNRPSQR